LKSYKNITKQKINRSSKKIHEFQSAELKRLFNLKQNLLKRNCW